MMAKTISIINAIPLGKGILKKTNLKRRENRLHGGVPYKE